MHPKMYTIETEACVFQVAAAYATCLAKGLKTYMKMLIEIIPEWYDNGWFLHFLFANFLSVFREHIRKKNIAIPWKVTV